MCGSTAELLLCLSAGAMERFLIYLYIVFKSSCYFCRNLAHLYDGPQPGVPGYGKKNSLI